MFLKGVVVQLGLRFLPWEQATRVQISATPSSERMISIEDFQRVDVRVGRIIDVQDFPEAKKKFYKLKIDFGELGIKTSSAQITTLYSKEELIGKQVIAVVNLPPKKIANFVSEVLVLGVDDEEGNVVLLIPDKKAKIGSRMY
jgi:tRNA-binding protein